VVSRLHSRIERIEAAPRVSLIRERREARRKEIEKFRAFIQPDLDAIMQVAEYCGLPSLVEIRAQIESDWIEQELLLFAEYSELFGDAERTEERAIESIIKSDTKYYRELYGLKWSPDDITSAGSLGRQVREDIKAGIPASESEAAQQTIKNEATRATRLKKHTDAYAAYIAGLDSRIPDCEFTGQAHEL
jgi:hypothetical protein